MYKRFKDRFGTAGVVLGVIAIVLAIGGSAIAASGLNGKQKKQVKAIAKQFAGKPGAAGPAGAAGKDGTNGTNGTNGVGTKGDPGDPGTSVTGIAATIGECPNGGEKYTSASGDKAICNGAPGAAPTSTESAAEFNPGGHCNGTTNGGLGGSKFVSGATTTYACNGKNGTDGADGSPWVVGTAPSGVVLKGTWAVQQYTAAGAGELIPIPLSTGVPIGPSGFVAVGMVKPGENLPGQSTTEREEVEGFCPGNANNALPPINTFVFQACAYVKSATNFNSSFEADVEGSGGGIILKGSSAAAGVVKAYGSWSMIAP